MDINTIRLGYALLFLLSGVLHIYNAHRYATLIRASFFLTGVVLLSFAASLTIQRMADTSFALVNGTLLATFIVMQVVVQVLISLNGLIDPQRRRKGE